MEKTRYKVLLIEDNQLDQMAFKRYIETNGIPYDYTIADSIAEGKRALNTKPFDIIISDHSLGDGTAIDVLECAKDMPVIVVTGAGDEETAVKAWKAGAYDYLVKDINQEYLKAIPRTAENAIRHNMMEKKLQLLSGAVRSTEDSVFITDMQGKIIFVNKAFCRTYGYKEEEIVGQNGNNPLDRPSSKQKHPKRFSNEDNREQLRGRLLSPEKRRQRLPGFAVQIKYQRCKGK